MLGTAAPASPSPLRAESPHRWSKSARASCLAVALLSLSSTGCSEIAAGMGDSGVSPDAVADGGPDDPDGSPEEPTPSAGLPYPTRSPYRIKGLQPDYWATPDEIAGNNTGGVAINFVWAQWEPERGGPPPCADSQQEYDGRCFNINPTVDQAVADWTSRGAVVTGVLYGVPAWARTGPCSPIGAGFEVFCRPDDAADYGRFVGMIAQRYNGENGRGRVADFVIHNEVNSNDWFDIGCGQGVPCDLETWLSVYADNFNAAYDEVVRWQSEAKVLVSFTHHFAIADDLSSATPVVSVKSFLEGLDARVGDRHWRVAYHPYPPNLLTPDISADDLPKVTYGNIGVLSGWLHQRFPDKPWTWELQLTESGINSTAPSSSESAQALVMCASLRNILATPGIESYIYHRMQDHPAELAGGLGLGLRRADGSAKPAWAVWAMANRIDLQPPQLDCGFEDLPYTRLTRWFSGARGHWASSRRPPAGFVAEQSWLLHREQQPGTAMVYECQVGAHNLLTLEAGCNGGLQPLGPVGFIYTTQVADTIPVHHCRVGEGSDHFVSSDPGCEGQVFERTLGYALPGS